jgi:hypothetical protein|tara:strand:- start:291 stop:449 length:159 start_codon:yes stop_codon:yes gene_type:complete
MTDDKEKKHEALRSWLMGNQLSHRQTIDFLDKRPEFKNWLKEYFIKSFNERS